MPAMANITVFDGAATPVSHTFVPVTARMIGKVITAEWREMLTGVPTYAQPRLRHTLERAKTGVYKVEQRVEVPVMESISGQNAAGYTAAPKVAYTNTVVTTGWFHERSDIAGRRLARQLSTNLLGNISTSVTPQTSGFAPELFDQLVVGT